METVNQDIELDPSLGISLDEQKEILESINSISAMNSLSHGDTEIKPKKKAFLFPLIVNIGALIILASGFFFLSILHNQDDEGIREASSALGLSERRLIQEIRQETNRLLTEKESEINDVLNRLSEADSEYRTLLASVEIMSEAQRERAAYLYLSLEEYRESLLGLQNDRTRIIEESRLQEAGLRSRDAHDAQDLESLSLAMEELRLLGDEQDRARRAESQMLSFYGIVNNQIAQNNVEEAFLTLAAMREFLNAPSFRGLRIMETSIQSHFAAISALENMLVSGEGIAHNAGLPAESEEAITELSIAELLSQNEELERRLGMLEDLRIQQEENINAILARGTDTDSMLAEIMIENNELREANINQQETLNRRDSEIVALRSQILQQNEDTSVLNRIINDGEAALSAQIRENNALMASIDELQIRHDNLQERLDAVLLFLQGE